MKSKITMIKNKNHSNETFKENFNNTIKSFVLAKRKEVGFVDKDKSYTDKEMFDLAIEYEVYNNILNHIKDRTFNEAMLVYENENRNSIEFNNNYLKYRYIIKQIYENYYLGKWSPNQIVSFMQNQISIIKQNKVCYS